MTVFDRLNRWKQNGVLSAEQHAMLDGFARGKPFSVFLELNVLLYTGVLAFIGGLGWTVQTHFQQLGDAVVLIGLSGLLAACLGYCFLKAAPYTHAEAAVPSLVFDYVLYLGSLTWSVELGYLESRFHLLSGQWNLYLLASAGVFFALAYRFDNRFVLSLALSTLAGWFGLKISEGVGSHVASYRSCAILYSVLIGVAGVALHALRVKRHFLGTYLNVAANGLLIALLSGVFERDGSSTWMFVLALACGASLAYGVRRRFFAYVAYAAVYGYIGISTVLMRGMHDTTGLLSYFVVSGTAMLVGLTVLSRRFGRDP